MDEIINTVVVNGGDIMKKIIIPLILLSILSGCNFSDKSKEKFNDKKRISNVKSAKSNIISIKSLERFNNIVLKNEKPTIVKFETKWCGACKTMAPIYSKLSHKYRKQINFVTADIQKIPELTSKYQLQGVPTFILFKNGKIVDRIIGSKPEKPFEDELTKLL